MKIEGINEVMEQVEDFKKTLNSTTGAATKVSRANTVIELIDRLSEAGYFTPEERVEALLDAGELVGFHLREYKQ